MNPQPMIAVLDVAASSRWYQKLLGCKSNHGGGGYDCLVSDGVPVLQLHRWNTEAHPFLGDPKSESNGNGVLLWFRIDDFDAAISRAVGLEAQILEEPHVNPNAGHRECWIRDLDGYVVVLAGPHGDVG
jgi:catechol 2,3-dioxygenase-like lactoylglutathione lyase family enzyme